MIVLIEGNIGAGKTTYLKYIEYELKRKEKDIMCSVLYEPVDKWLNLNNNYDLLDMFYKESDNYIAADLQIYIILTMMKNHWEAHIKHNNNNQQIILMERSVLTGVECFAKVLNSRGKIHDRLYDILKEGVKQMHMLKPDHIIYLKINHVPMLMDRISKRGRECEQTNANSNILTEKYLKDLNDAYDDFMYNTDIPVTVIPMNDSDDIEVMYKTYISPLITNWMKEIKKNK